MAGLDFPSCDDGSSSMLNLSSLLQLASLFTSFATASPKSWKSPIPSALTPGMLYAETPASDG